MVFKGRIDCDARARIYYLSRVRGLSVRKVAELCGVSRSSVFRIAQEGGVNKCPLRPASRKGRPRKLTERQKRLIIKSIVTLRTEEGNFSAARIMEQAGIDNFEVPVRTVTRFLNEKGYYYLQARKKGLLKREDLKTRLSFAKWCKKDLPENFGLSVYRSFWTELDLPTNQIHVNKLAQQRGGHGERYQRDLSWVVHPRDEKRELAEKC